MQAASNSEGTEENAQIHGYLQSENTSEGEVEMQECLEIESKFSNEVQRKSIFDLNRNMETKPLVIELFCQVSMH